MLKTSLAIAALLAGAVVIILPASAQDMRAQASCGPGSVGHSCYNNDYGSGPYSRYCPPGYFPHSWPNGNGVRCEEVGGDTHLDSY